MKNISYLFLLFLILFSSCIREDLEPCPPLQVTITVKDKNYSNIDEVAWEDKMNEDEAFRTYVPSLCYTLREAATGKIWDQKEVFRITGEDKSYTFTGCDCLPHGKYVLTVWGGLKDNTSLKDDPLTAHLHPEGVEGDDFYMANDTLVYDEKNTHYTIALERTKGKLIIQVENLPAEMNYSQNTITGIYQDLDCEFNYLHATSVHTQTRWDTIPSKRLKTFLAPSLQEKGSNVKLNFSSLRTKTPLSSTPDDVNITLERNKLTVLKYVYDEREKDFTIYLLVNDAWDVIHDLNIDN